MPIYGTSIGLSASTIGLISRASRPRLSSCASACRGFRATCASGRVGDLLRRLRGLRLLPMVETVPLLAAISFLLGLKAWVRRSLRSWRWCTPPRKPGRGRGGGRAQRRAQRGSGIAAALRRKQRGGRHAAGVLDDGGRTRRGGWFANRSAARRALGAPHGAPPKRQVLVLKCDFPGFGGDRNAHLRVSLRALHTSGFLLKVSDAPLTVCTKCGAGILQMVTAAGFS